jgi:hypothetical protein
MFNPRIRQLFFDACCKSGEEMLEVAAKSVESGKAVDITLIFSENVLKATYRALFMQEMDDGPGICDLFKR